MVRERTVWTFVGVLSLAALLAGPALAAAKPGAKRIAMPANRGAKLAVQYAAEFDFKPRVITLGPNQRRVERVFVPVTAASFDKFLQTFSAKNGFAGVRYTARNQHTAMWLKPGDCYLWAKNTTFEKYMSADRGGFGVVIDLRGKPLQHLSQWLSRPLAAKQWANEQCMRWLPNAPVSPDVALFHHLGITRANSGPAQAEKLVHAANAKVQVIGAFVSTATEFNKKSDRALLGSMPAAGVEEAVR